MNAEAHCELEASSGWHLTMWLLRVGLNVLSLCANCYIMVYLPPMHQVSDYLLYFCKKPCLFYWRIHLHCFCRKLLSAHSQVELWHLVLALYRATIKVGFYLFKTIVTQGLGYLCRNR